MSIKKSNPVRKSANSKAGRLQRAPSRREPLSRERIVLVALAVTERAGVAGLSMRGLALELKVEPMSLYHWFKSRDHLLDGMLDAVLADVAAPPTGSFIERLGALEQSFRAACRRHPGFVPFLVVHRFNTRHALSVLESVLGVLVEVFPDPGRRAGAFRLWIHWLTGFCLDEAAGFGKGPSAQDPPPLEEIQASFRRVSELGPFNRPEHFDELFAEGQHAVHAALERLADASG